MIHPVELAVRRHRRQTQLVWISTLAAGAAALAGLVLAAQAEVAPTAAPKSSLRVETPAVRAVKPAPAVAPAPVPRGNAAPHRRVTAYA